METDNPSNTNSKTQSGYLEPPVVAGGEVIIEYGTKDHTDTVEIFKPDTSQWYKTDPLPTPCGYASLTIIGNAYYALGGVGEANTHLNQAHYASLDDLLQNAVPAHQSSSGYTR